MQGVQTQVLIEEAAEYERFAPSTRFIKIVSHPCLYRHFLIETNFSASRLNLSIAVNASDFEEREASEQDMGSQMMPRAIH